MLCSYNFWTSVRPIHPGGQSVSKSTSLFCSEISVQGFFFVGCPFKHSDPEILAKRLQMYKVPKEGIDEVCFEIIFERQADASKPELLPFALASGG